MKLVKIVDQEGSNLVSDPINQKILLELVSTEQSVKALAEKFNLPTLNMWRRMQRMQKAKMVELIRTEKVGNIEKKLYRATATWYAPQQYFNFKPKDPNLQEAFAIYSEIQNSLMQELTTLNEVPKNADAIDYSLFANMTAFASVSSKPATQAKIAKLKSELAKFQQGSGYLQK